MKTPHTSCPRGKSVRIKLKDGRIITGRFLERTSKHVVLQGWRIPAGEIKSFSISR